MKNLKYLNQHAKPVTRREFVSRGLISAGGFAMAPSLLSILLKSSRAHAKGFDNSPPAPRFITFDLVGGAALFANFLVGGHGGPEDLLDSYDLLGWDPRKPNALDRSFGLPMAGNGVGKILDGINKGSSVEARAHFRMASLLHVGQIDTSDNPLSILSLVSASQLTDGKSLTSTLGLSQSVSGANSKPLLDLPNNRPFYVSDLTALLQAVGLSGSLFDLNNASKSRIGKLLNRLSNSQLKSMLGGPLSRAGYEHLSDSLGKMETHVNATADMDPRLNEIFKDIYGISENSKPTDDKVLRAALVMNALNGNTGPAAISISGCDYHDGSQTTGDAKDLEIGIEIGRAIEAAKRLKVSLFIHIITDGGIYPDQGTRIWRGDSVDKSMSVIGYFQPDGIPKFIKSDRMQLGAYSNAQGADRSTLIGASPALAANVAFANYLNCAGKLDLLTQIFPASAAAAELRDYLVFS